MAELERRLQALAEDAFPPAPDVTATVATRVAASGLLRADAPAADRGPATEPPSAAAPTAERGRAGEPPSPDAPATERGRAGEPPLAQAPDAGRGRAGAPRRALRGRGAGTRLDPRRRALALALALVLLPAGAVAAVPSARRAVLDWLGLEHVRVERVPRLPQRSGPGSLDLGGRVASVRAASGAAGFAVEAPRALGPPDAVHVARDGVVSLAYQPRRGLGRDRETGLGLLVTELRALQRFAYITKDVGPKTRVEAVRVGGAPGVFLSGDAHAVTIERPGRGIGELAPRLAGNALVLERHGLVIRLEGRFDRRRALELARSLRPG
ncbi:MAG: hypothetical protein QOJ35_268 [Solirubrobacteraceae bacterium]|jgi:hypothetical protein|nr:hypothetical protein [Solirubrobacteraceae bacterium]